MSNRKIVQIMPAQGWVARFAEKDDEYLTPLVGWALVQDGDSASVIGLAAGKDVELCDADPAFAGYAYLPDVMSEMLDDLDEMEDDDAFEDEDDDGPSEPPRRPSRLN